MRKVSAILATVLTAALVWLLSRPIGGAVPALGPLLDPVHGWATNAEPAGKNWTENLKIKGLQAPVDVWLEARLVPHIRAQNDHDLYLALGYLHAKARLWQMDLQTRAAAGRVSEVVGDRALDFDRGQRRKGMGYAAENSLRAMEAEPRTKAMLDAYTSGVNAFIAQTHGSFFAQPLPLEYKLMGFRPEWWTNLRTALLMKYMADDLTGYTEDLPLTQLRDALPPDEFNFLYPERTKGSRPAIPEGTKWEAPSMAVPSVPGVPDSLFAHFAGAAAKATAGTNRAARRCHSEGISAVLKNVGREFLLNDNVWDAPDVSTSHQVNESTNQQTDDHSGIGSNAWAIAPQHTADSAAILCNDPHLGLNLPSLWYEVQLTAPGINCYGVSLPGAPGIVIGFNDSVSWGLTNNYRDVKDYYEISTADADHYWFSGARTAYQNRIERIGVKGRPDVVDTVRYTVHGPVQYPDTNGKALAMQWMAHRATNELLALYLLNRAQGYDQYVQAIHHFECPAQNIMYADRKGNIAQWGQGRFINKWPGQGRFVMEGKDSLTLWGDAIPMAENPHALNPAQGFLVGANQTNTDSTYPYWYNGTFAEWRSWTINYLLSDKIGDYSKDALNSLYAIQTVLFPRNVCGMANGGRGFDLKMVMVMQCSKWSLLSHSLTSKMAVSNYTRNAGKLIPSGAAWQQYANSYERELFPNDLAPNSQVASFFSVYRNFLFRNIWADESFFQNARQMPTTERTIQILLSDSTSSYYDDKTTPQKETFADVIQRSFQQTVDSLQRLGRGAMQRGYTGEDSTSPLAWYKVKNTTLLHLAKIPAFSFYQLKTGGDGNCINAMKERYGPSWRMIVQMGRSSIEAYGVYPGGQSGNPGSPFYSDFIAKWEAGDYFRLMFVPVGVVAKPDWAKWVVRMEPG